MRAHAEILLLWLLFASHGLAHDGYEGLKSSLGGSCCGNGDCGPTEVRQGSNGLQALITRDGAPNWSEWENAVPLDGLWVDVPEKAVLPSEDNPAVGPSVCWLKRLGVLCFMMGRAG